MMSELVILDGKPTPIPQPAIVVEEASEDVSLVVANASNAGFLSDPHPSELESEDTTTVLANRIRKALVNAFTKNGTVIPTEIEKATLIAKIASDMDKQASDRSKRKIEQAIVGDVAAGKAAIMAMFHSQKDALHAAQAGTIPKPMTIEPEDFTPVPGQGEIHPHQETFEEFTQRMGQ
jgi:hypothetical protein